MVRPRDTLWKCTPKEPDQQWWLDCGRIAELYEWLCDEGDIDPKDVSNVRYFISKPWKWDLEYRAMRERKQLESQLTASLEVHRGRL